MNKSMLASITLLIAIFILLPEITHRAHGQNQNARDSQKFEPVMPVFSLMIEQERHFEKITSLIRDDSAKERFENLRHEALALAEMANINAYHKLAARHDDYRNWTIDLKNSAVKLADFAKTKDLDQAKLIVGKINQTCNACHDKHH